MKACLHCGEENPERARFCLACGAELAPAAGVAREERKVVTVLFADLVGFTGQAERLDPEEVRAVLQPYHARLRAELERFGGTVEKFIGDAVMAVFGAPVAHEDDPERASRGGLGSPRSGSARRPRASSTFWRMLSRGPVRAGRSSS
jgi:class 3 adenylate cyclase